MSDDKFKFEIPPIKGEALRDAHQEHLVRVNHQNPEPPVLGERVLRKLDLAFLRANQGIERFIPESLNPLAQTGAVANASLIISIISGILLLIWYSTSVHTAYSSVQAMTQAPWTAQFMRSLHRYSSDACILFVLIHAAQIFVARRFTGPRWVAWITGIILLGFLFVLGWTGYWLVWDERGGQVARASAKLLDVLPIFADPLSRSFLVDDTINTLLFFVIFFLHMLLPMALAIALWLHLSRLSRPHYLTKWKMTLAVVVSLAAVSLIFPADTAEPANMQKVSTGYGLDWLYLAPLYLIDRMSGGAFWLLALFITTAGFTVPWWMTRRHAEPAFVLEPRCNGCQQCYHDCPYNAIDILPTQGGKWDFLAKIDPDKCVGCGICVGSCNPGAIIFPKLPVQDAKGQIHKFLDRILEEEEAPYVAFLCANSAGSDLQVDQETGRCDHLPGYRIIPVPCSGWVHPLMVERAVREGAQGVLVVGCGPDPMYRTGTLWTELRLSGERFPQLRDEKVKGARVKFMRYDRSNRSDFLEAARDFRGGAEVTTPSANRGKKTNWLQWTLATILLTILFAVPWGLNQIQYTPPGGEQPKLVISFKHPGQLVEVKKKDKKSDEKLLPHMKGSPSALSRKRVPVRLQVYVDGRLIVEKTYPPRGLFEDGNSVAMETILVDPGSHRVKIRIGDGPDKDKWNYESERTIEFSQREKRVVIYDKLVGFKWH